VGVAGTDITASARETLKSRLCGNGEILSDSSTGISLREVDRICTGSIRTSSDFSSSVTYNRLDASGMLCQIIESSGS